MFPETRYDKESSMGTVESAPNAAPQAVRWLAYYTAPRHEKTVAKHLECRCIDCFLPLVRSPRRWKNGMRVRVDEPLFPATFSPRSYRGDISSC